MGIRENEPLENQMISNAIKNAQQKLEKQVIIDHSAPSQRNWLEKNLPVEKNYWPHSPIFALVLYISYQERLREWPDEALTTSLQQAVKPWLLRKGANSSTAPDSYRDVGDR